MRTGNRAWGMERGAEGGGGGGEGDLNGSIGDAGCCE